MQSSATETRELGQDWIRLPGLFRRWELEGVTEQGEDYFFEQAGTCDAGLALFAVYHRKQRAEASDQ